MAEVVKIGPRLTASPKTKTRPKRAARALRRQALSGAAVGAITVAMIGLSLAHVAHGISLTTGAPEWECQTMAGSIDLGYGTMEVAQLAAATEAVRRAVNRWTRPFVLATIAGSAIFNAYAFAHGAPTTLNAVLAGALGAAIPVMIYAMTRTGAIMWLGARS